MPATSTSTPDRLAEFNVPDALHVEPARHDLASLHVDTDDCTGRLYLLGATLTEWQPAGQRPVLFTSRASWFKEGHPIRGGVPLCFPWFGPHPSDPDAPSHGLVRAKPWNPVNTAATPDGVRAELVTNLDKLHVSYQVTFGRSLHLKFIVSNLADTEQRFEAALHTYLAVGDATKVKITGLEGADYLDKMHNAERRNQGDAPITFTEETDRVYVDTEAACTLHDPVLGRRITVAKRGSRSTVIWNPWTAKAARMEDFGDEEWKQMCCIETANVGKNAITIGPGESHEMSATISVATAE